VAAVEDLAVTIRVAPAADSVALAAAIPAAAERPVTGSCA
jgi:hypothetical protein